MNIKHYGFTSPLKKSGDRERLPIIMISKLLLALAAVCRLGLARCVAITTVTVAAIAAIAVIITAVFLLAIFAVVITAAFLRMSAVKNCA